MISIKCDSRVFIWSADTKGSWHFASIEAKIGKMLKDNYGLKRGWGSVPVKATIGKTSWDTSIFPNKDGTYVLPIKSQVRKSENISHGDSISLKLELR